MKKQKRLKLPRTLPTGGDPIHVIRGSDIRGIGQWDERTGTITIRPGQHNVGEHIVLIHEAMHLAETLLIQDGTIKRRMPERYIESASFIIMNVLASCGAMKLIDDRELADFMRSEK